MKTQNGFTNNFLLCSTLLSLVLSSCDPNKEPATKAPKPSDRQALHQVENETQNNKTEKQKALEKAEENFRQQLSYLQSLTSKEIKDLLIDAHSRRYSLYKDSMWDLKNIDFRKTNMQGLIDIFIKTNFSGSDFYRANLMTCNFSGSNLYQSDFTEADLSAANLTNTKNLKTANFNQAIITPMTKVSPTDLKIIKESHPRLMSLDEYFEDQLITPLKSFIKNSNELVSNKHLSPDINQGCRNINYLLSRMPRFEKEHIEVEKFINENPGIDIAEFTSSNAKIRGEIDSILREIPKILNQANFLSDANSIHELTQKVKRFKELIESFKSNNPDAHKYFYFN